jgi:ketosteroid isomerase-like protein
MRYVIGLLLCVASAIALGFAHPSLADDRVQLLALEHKWAQAAVKGDAEGMGHLMADDYVEITMVADTATNKTKWKNTGKKDWLELIRSGHEKYESVDLSNLQVYFHGDVATVTGEYSQTGTRDATDISATGLYVDTWIKKSGQWRVVSSVFP